MFLLVFLREVFLFLHFHSRIKNTSAIVNSKGFVEDLISENGMGIYLCVNGFWDFDFLIRREFMFFGLFGDGRNMILNRLWIENVFNVHTWQVDLRLGLLLAGCEFYMLVENILKGKQVLINIIEVNVILNLINQKGNSSEGFTGVIIVPNVSDRIEEPCP